MKVIIIANTIIGRKGNIGFRLGKVVNLLKTKNFDYELVVRGCDLKDVNHVSFFLQAYFARLFNFIKIYLWRNFPARKFDIFLFELFSIFVVFIFLRKKLNEDTVIHLLEPCPNLIRILKNKGIKVVLDLPIAPSRYVEDLKSKGFNPIIGNPSIVDIENLAIKSVDLVITPSHFVNDEVKKINPDSETLIIPFGTTLNEWQRSFDKVNFDSIKFCFVGNLSKRKGVDYLLDAWEDFRDTNHELWLCGRIYPEIKKILNDKSFTNVYCPGFVDVSSYYKKCNVYLFPSIMEGSSKSIYEAMSFSMPIVTTYESGSVVRNAIDGFIVEKLNSKCLAAAIKNFIDEPLLIKKMGSSSSSYIKGFTWHTYACNLMKCYESILLD